MTRCRLDERNLILIAAAASGVDAADVLEEADLGALARATAAIEACDDRLDIAAAALVAVASQQPFGAASNATAWLACALAAPREAACVSGACDAEELVRQAACGEATRNDVRHLLGSAGRPSRGHVVRMCAACGRAVSAKSGKTHAREIVGHEIELVARCAREHGAHGRFGERLPASTLVDDTPWRPVVMNERTGALLVLADAKALVVVPRGDDYVVAEPRFTPGDLVGDWRPLIERAEHPSSVPSDAVVLDERQSMIDWRALEVALEAHA